MENVRIAETFTLPSKGLIYEEEIDPDVILSSMKTKHEMLRLSVPDDSQKLMAEIIDDCIESNLGISSYDLCLGDFQYLMFMLRVVTFGADYELYGKCPFCGFEQSYKVRLDDLEVKEYDDSLVDFLTLELPVTKAKLELTLQTPRMLDRINVRSKEYRRKHKNSDENPMILFTIMASIVKIDDEEPSAFKLEQWVKELPLADTNAIINRIDKLNSLIGIDVNVEEDCKICNTAYRVPFRVTREFFRPNSEL